MILFGTVLFLLTFISTEGAQFEDECVISFVTQPPPVLPCNPYSSGFNELNLECNIVIPVEVSYKVYWFRTTATKKEVEPETLRRRNDDRLRINRSQFIVGNLTTIRSRLSIIGVNASDIGNYWCQVEVNDDSFDEQSEFRSCSSTILEPADEYDSLTPCPNTHLSLPSPVCVYPQYDCGLHDVSSTASINLLISASPQSSQIISNMDNSDGEMNEVFLLPLWAYGVLVIIVLMVISVFVVSISCLVMRRRKKRNDKHQHTIIQVPTVTTSNIQLQAPTIRVSEPILPTPHFNECKNKHKNSLPAHLTVSRQPSNESDYKEMPNLEMDEKSSAKNGIKMAKMQHKPHLPVKPKRSRSLPSVSQHQTSSKPTESDHLSDSSYNPPVFTRRNNYHDQPIQTEAPPKVNERSYSLPHNRTHRLQQSITITELLDSNRNEDPDSHIYVNHGTVSSSKNYQALNPETQNFPVYSRPLSFSDEEDDREEILHLYQPPKKENMDKINHYQKPVKQIHTSTFT